MDRFCGTLIRPSPDHPDIYRPEFRLSAVMATHWNLGGDADDPHRPAAFWAQALRYFAEPGYDDPDGTSIIAPEGKAPAIGWLRVPEGKSTKKSPPHRHPRGRRRAL